ncbi:MAG: peptide-methionine (S)-S-oxide reductase, partial [Streptococcus suis]
MKEIYLAGGCFWGMEGYFSQIDGILDTSVGYANGQVETTNY